MSYSSSINIVSSIIRIIKESIFEILVDPQQSLVIIEVIKKSRSRNLASLMSFESFKGLFHWTNFSKDCRRESFSSNID